MSDNIFIKTSSSISSNLSLMLEFAQLLALKAVKKTKLCHQLVLRFMLMLVLALGIVTPTFAVVSNIGMVLIPGKSGQAPFDSDDAPGHDSSGDNNIVRTNDRFDYRVTYTAEDTNQVNFVFTAPNGVYWLNSGANTSVCNGTGGPVLSAGGRILTCPRKPSGVQIESFELPAIAGNIANATEFTIGITAGAATGTSQVVKISAIPRTEIYVQGGSYNKSTVGGVFGATYGLALRVGVATHTSGSSIGTAKGIESPKVPFTITLSTLPPGTIVTSCPGTCSQPGGPGTPVSITLSNQNNAVVNSGGVYGSNGVVANFKEFSYNGINFFTPFGTRFPAGAKTPLNMQFTDFAPESLSGVANYSGSTATGYAPNFTPGYAPGFNACPDWHSCIRLTIDRTIKTELYTHFHGTYYTPTGDLIFGDSEASTNNPGNGAESVMPGQFFTIMYPISNSTTAEEAAHNLGSCVVWDPAKMELQGKGKLKIGGGGEFFRVGHLGWPDVTAANHILEYSAQTYASDTARRNASCGVAGDGNANWFTDPTAVPGGLSAVSSARYKYSADLVPGATVGFTASFRRPLTSYSLNAAYMTLSPWFMQFWADEKARTFPSPYGGSGLSGYGGRVNFVNALFRHKITASATSVAPGGIINLTITPIAIGSSITGVDAVVKNAKVKVNMPDTCLEPVAASLPSFATLTPPNYGADGIPCTGDSGETAANVVFSLGDFDAPGGAITAGGYQGRATFQPSFNFNILAASKSPVKTVTWTSVDSADNDPTPVSHTGSGNVSIAGVAGFSVSKTTSGVNSGKIGPNETFNYIINFGNGGSASSGKGRFVDLLPFDGDDRGTIGLGSGKLVVTGLSAGMASAAQGTVAIQVSTDDPLTIQTSLKTAGQEDGSVGINWTDYVAGSVVPTGVTAVRFITSQDLKSGFSGFGSIQVKGPTVKKSTTLFNNVWGRTDAFLGDSSTVKIMRGIANLTLQGIDGSTIRGKVFIDLNDNGIIETTEVGLPNTVVKITCTAGGCLTAPQGTVFSVKTDASGGYSFEPNLVNKIFPNGTATGTALASFDGTVVGTWTISETPPTTQPFVNVSSIPGTINNVPTGDGAGRSITGVAMVSNGIGVNFNFGERLEHGKITVTAKPITLPTGVTGPFTFEYEATCDLPVANSKFSATLTNFPTNNKVDIVNIPAGASCTLTEKVPTPPAGFVWDVPSFTALTPTGTMAPGGTQTSDVTNALISGFTVQKEVLSGPTPLVAQNTKHEITYRISVINRLAAEQTYSLSDALGFDPDVTIVGTPTVTTSSNVSNSLNAGFTGLASNTQLISNEKVSAGSSAVPTIETYDIKVTIDQTKVSSANDSCNAAAGNGLFNTATMSFGSSSVTANACTNTPSLKPVEFVMQVFWESGRVGAQMNVPGIEFAVSSAAANTMSSINFGPGTRTSGDSLTVKVGDSGILPGHSFVSQEDNPYHKISPWRCNEELFSPGDRYTVPTTAAGSQTGVVCVLTIKGLSLGTTKTAVPESGKSVAVDDVIEYTLTTNLDGAELQEDFVLKDTLGSGLTFFGTTPDGCEVNKQVLTCTVPSRSLPGEYKFVYKAKVDQDADTISSTGISNKVVSSLGACDSCSTLHTMWTADTKKVSDAAGKKGVRIGDNIRYTVSVTIKNGPSTQAITVKDTRSVGLLVTKVPDGCSQNGRVITCVVPAGSANGVHSFIYNATVTKDAGDYVTNKAVSDKGTCLTSCSTTVKVLKEVVLRVTKTNNVKQVKIGDFVRYEILVENLSDIDANEFFILDKAAPGLSYVEGSVRVTGDASWSVQSNYPLKIAQLDLEAGKKLTISYLMRVGAGAGRGKLSNQAWADDDQDFVSSNIATASVTRGSDPDFEDTHIMGVVFEDRNGNGIQDESEPGIAGARLTTAQGLIVETDAFGRYHIEGIDPGAVARGSNYVVKLDTNSIPKGSKLTTQNPLVKRLTHGIPVVFNFGIR